MKKTFGFLTLFLLVPSLSFAALSPLNQSIVELKQILESSEINERLPQEEAIQTIIHDKNIFLLQTKTTTWEVEVEYLTQRQVGPRPFKLIFREPIKHR